MIKLWRYVILAILFIVLASDLAVTAGAKDDKLDKYVTAVTITTQSGSTVVFNQDLTADSALQVLDAASVNYQQQFSSHTDFANAVETATSVQFTMKKDKHNTKAAKYVATVKIVTDTGNTVVFNQDITLDTALQVLDAASVNYQQQFSSHTDFANTVETATSVQITLTKNKPHADKKQPKYIAAVTVTTQSGSTVVFNQDLTADSALQVLDAASVNYQQQFSSHTDFANAVETATSVQITLAKDKSKPKLGMYVATVKIVTDTGNTVVFNQDITLDTALQVLDAASVNYQQQFSSHTDFANTVETATSVQITLTKNKQK